jgi:CO dehydrogenase maturation factor
MAWLGKGGAGKTALSALTAKLLMKNRGSKLLLVDADPAMGLTLALGIKRLRTIADARAEIIKDARQARNESDKRQMAMMVDYLVMECLKEEPGFSFLSMGRSREKGCYCPVNSLLRESIEALAENFDYIVIDAEAGMEQVSREVTQSVSHPIIVTDSSLRGIAAALAIANALKTSVQAQPAGVIFNRVEIPDRSLLKLLKESKLRCLGHIPPDQNISRFDREGKSLLNLPEKSKALTALAEILSFVRL